MFRQENLASCVQDLQDRVAALERKINQRLPMNALPRCAPYSLRELRQVHHRNDLLWGGRKCVVCDTKENLVPYFELGNEEQMQWMCRYCKSGAETL